MKKNINKIKPVILIILDGWGVAPESKGNAVTLANTPNFNHYKEKYPYTEVCAFGECVGLPKNQPGNSEAGHLNLGAGRAVKDDAVYISESIKDETFFKNPAFLEGISHLKKYKSKVHLIGLVTEENSAHSSPEHWLAMLKLLEEQKVEEVFLHLFTDGRDSSQHAAIRLVERFEQKINHDNHHLKVNIASISGRFYAMDRTKQWDRVEKVYNLLVLGKGFQASTPKEAIVQAYNRQETDEFILPTIIKKDHQPTATIDDNDLVIFMNLRSDRARELSKAFVQKEFNQKNPGSFKRKKWPKNLFFVALADFGPDLDHIRTAYPSRIVKNSLPVIIDGLPQLYITEAEKFAHVTFFFNGGYDHSVSGEERIIVPSPDVSHYDLTPEMSTRRITKIVLEKIKTQKFYFIMMNFCNADMIGHTGDLQATIKGIECVDESLGKIIKAGKKHGYSIIVTADHGNAEEMINLTTGEVDTKHSINPVPFILVNSDYKGKKLRKDGVLADVAPTILELMGLKKSKEMTGVSLLK
ncbi:MAG: 2,3-bisphosphoglycerate-independent phosphoglycerate mutase [Patescibacteria group bacterium]|jgi:2,3-bisphosphoglycerate-independent phosphoglycerate mutase